MKKFANDFFAAGSLKKQKRFFAQGRWPLLRSHNITKKTKPILALPLILTSLFFFTGCKDPYDIKVPNAQQQVLVVEGFLNSGGPTTIKLSRSYDLSDASTATTETGASVMVESGTAQYNLLETSTGTYVTDLGTLNPTAEYRLHINTSNGKEYVSDYVKVQTTPPIDSVNWVRTNKGVTIYANTHDDTKGSLYYKYDYEETWETDATFLARIVYDQYNPGSNYTRFLGPNEQIYRCWTTQPSHSINVATSTALQNDVIYENPLVFIPQSDGKLNVRYSILAKQYVLPKETYEFFQLMKKNTESLGTVFDPQPSQITGNIHCLSDKTEPVVGFFYGSSEQQKRIFISVYDVPGWRIPHPCEIKKIAPNPDTVRAYVGKGLYPFEYDLFGFTLLDYQVADPICFDCTITGGSTVKPPFW